jgi:hypothetical protein
MTKAQQAPEVDAEVLAILRRGNVVYEWPDDEASAYRDNDGFQEGQDAVDVIRVAKIKRAILPENPDPAVIEAIRNRLTGENIGGYPPVAICRDEAEELAHAAYAALRGARQ